MTEPPVQQEAPHVLFSHAFAQALERCGVDAQQQKVAMRAAGATDSNFWTQELGMHAVQTYGRALVETANDPRLGLRLGHAVAKGATGVVEYVLLTAPSLRASHVLYARLGKLLGEYFTLVLVDQGAYTTTELVPPPSVNVDPFIEDYRLTRMLASTRQALVEPTLVPTSVAFTYARPQSTAPYEQAFGKGVAFEFGRARAGIRTLSQWLDQPLPSSDPLLHRILLQAAEQVLLNAPPPRSLAERLRQLLVATLHKRRPASAEAAKQLGLSERTLRRHLDEEGTSFAEVLEDVRATLARVLMCDPERSAKVVASQLGFESTSSLRRAQKRWAEESSSRSAQRSND